MKFIKILYKVLKWYLLFTAFGWAFIGISELAEEIDKEPDENLIKRDERIIIRAYTRFKNFFQN